MINQFRIEAKTLGAMVGFGQDLENFVTAIVNSLSSFGIDTSQIASANTQYVTDLSTTQDSLTLASGQLGSLAGSQAPNQQLLTQIQSELSGAQTSMDQAVATLKQIHQVLVGMI